MLTFNNTLCFFLFVQLLVEKFDVKKKLTTTVLTLPSSHLHHPHQTKEAMAMSDDDVQDPVIINSGTPIQDAVVVEKPQPKPKSKPKPKPKQQPKSKILEQDDKNEDKNEDKNGDKNEEKNDDGILSPKQLFGDDFDEVAAANSCHGPILTPEEFNRLVDKDIKILDEFLDNI